MLKVPFYPYATKVNRRQIVARAYQKSRRLSSQTSLQLQCRLGISQDLTTRMVQSQVRVATRWSLHKLSWKDITSDRSLVYHSYITDGLGRKGSSTTATELCLRIILHLTAICPWPGPLRSTRCLPKTKLTDGWISTSVLRHQPIGISTDRPWRIGCHNIWRETACQLPMQPALY